MDNSDSLGYKANLLPDKMFYRFFDAIDTTIDEFIESYEKGTMRSNLIRYLSSMGLTGFENETESNLISNIFSQYLITASKSVFQCNNCQRIWIQKSGSDEFLSFRPDDENDRFYMGILS